MTDKRIIEIIDKLIERIEIGLMDRSICITLYDIHGVSYPETERFKFVLEKHVPSKSDVFSYWWPSGETEPRLKYLRDLRVTIEESMNVS